MTHDNILKLPDDSELSEKLRADDRLYYAPAVPNLCGPESEHSCMYPYMASLQIGGSHFCGAALLDTPEGNIFLTAAHCSDAIVDINNAQVCVGLDTLNNNEGGCLPVEAYAHHDSWTGGLVTGTYDIAVIQTKVGVSSLGLGADVQSIALTNEPPQVGGDNLILQGWGRVETDVYPSQLQHVYLDTYIDELLYNHQGSDTVIHVARVSCGQVSCFGDSGSPLVARDSLTGELSVIGVTSYVQDDFCNAPTGFANVFPVVEWIEDTVEALQECEESTTSEWCATNSTCQALGEFCPDCPTNAVFDCSGDGDCCPQSWIGDGYGDCQDQAYGCDLTCYENDEGDCPAAEFEVRINSVGSCPDGQLEDCDGSGECWPEGWVGDGYCDGEDQQWGADLLCYAGESSDCPSISECGNEVCECGEALGGCMQDCPDYSCPEGRILDCSFAGFLCLPETWLGDGIADCGEEGQYNLSCHSGEAVDCDGCALTGDVTEDGVLNVIDIIDMVNIILGTSTTHPCADMNDDGMIDVIDVISAVNSILNDELEKDDFDDLSFS